MLESLHDIGVKCTVADKVDLKDGYDIFYVNRLQQERFADAALFDKNRKKYRLTRDQVEGSKCLILDPLPRIDEIDTNVDDLDNALYFKQASYGVPVRMALLSLLLDKS